MGAYSIKDLEQLTGIKAHTIRIWEQRYNIIEPMRTVTNIRYYDDEQLKYLLNVALLARHGYKISHISSLTREQFRQAVEKLYEQTLLHNTDVVLDLDANDLVVAMIDMDAERFHHIYENAVKNNGFERTVTHLIYPFLEKVGILWSIGQINPAHEHFISSLIRQKIIVGIDRLPLAAKGPSFMLFLPEGEHHEIGLLMAHYLLKKRGCRVYYLGQNLPESDVRIAFDTIRPEYVLSFFVDPAVLGNARAIVKALMEIAGDAEILIACRPTINPEISGKKAVHFLHSITELDQYIPDSV